MVNGSDRPEMRQYDLGCAIGEVVGSRKAELGKQIGIGQGAQRFCLFSFGS